jgi:hypothetical protein
MKTLLLTIAVAAAFLAAATQPASAETTTLKMLLADKYITFGNGAVNSAQPVIQADIFISFDTGFYIDLWGSGSFGDKVKNNLGNEIDLGVGWSHTWDSKWLLDLGTTYFDEPVVGKFGAGDILYSHVKVSHPLAAGIQVSAVWENYANMPHTGIEGGNLYALLFSRDFPVTDSVTFSLSAGPVYDDGGYGLESGILFRGNATLEWKVSEKFSIIPVTVNWYAPTMKDARQTDAMWMTGFSVKL